MIERAQLELLWRLLVPLMNHLADMLGKPKPFVTRRSHIDRRPPT